MEKQKRTIRRLIPVSPFDTAGLEAWFSEMAGQGLFVERTGYYSAVFQKNEARRLIYSLEPCDQYHEGHDTDVTEQYRLAGWEKSGEIWRKFLIFWADSEGAYKPELSEDIRKEGNASLKKTGHGCLFECAADVLLLAFWCFSILGKYGFWYPLTMVTPAVLCVLLVLTFGINFCWHLSDYCQIRRYLKGNLDKGGRKRIGKGRARSIYAVVIAVILCMGFLWQGKAVSWNKDLGEADTALPVPPITALSSESTPMEGTVTFHSSFVAPVQYEIVQSGPDARMLRMDYMELRFSGLINPVLKSMMSDQLNWSSAEPTEITTDLFDTAYMAGISESMHYLFVSLDSKIAAVCYIGPGYSEEFLETIHDAMVTWTEPEVFHQIMQE